MLFWFYETVIVGIAAWNLHLALQADRRWKQRHHPAANRLRYLAAVVFVTLVVYAISAIVVS